MRTAVEVTSIEPVTKTVRVRDLRTGHESVEFRTGHESVEFYDSLALCPGVSPVTPPLPGVDPPDIHVLLRIGDMDVIKAAVDGRGASGRPPIEHAVVIGAGYTGTSAWRWRRTCTRAVCRWWSWNGRPDHSAAGP